MSRRFKKSCGTCAMKLDIDELKLYIVKVTCKKHGYVNFRSSCLDHEKMTCSNCRFQKGRMTVKHEKKRIDDGGINFKYIYTWKIYCTREDNTIETVLEGTKHRASIPTCSLWELKE